MTPRKRTESPFPARSYGPEFSSLGVSETRIVDLFQKYMTTLRGCYPWLILMRNRYCLPVLPIRMVYPRTSSDSSINVYKILTTKGTEDREEVEKEDTVEFVTWWSIQKKPSCHRPIATRRAWRLEIFDIKLLSSILLCSTEVQHREPQSAFPHPNRQFSEYFSFYDRGKKTQILGVSNRAQCGPFFVGATITLLHRRIVVLWALPVSEARRSGSPTLFFQHDPCSYLL